mgnify:CR=1 FL=1
MKEKNQPHFEDLVKTVYHPKQVFDRVERGMKLDDVDEENYGKYILPHGKEIIMEDNKPKFSNYLKL